MRYQGRITEWNDERGFGFVVPNGGGERAFVHIKAFNSRRHRPAADQLIKYALTRDERGRGRAEQVEFVSLRSAPKPHHAPGRWRVVAAGVFLLAVIALVVAESIPALVLWVYLGMSAITFVVYAHDKSAAEAGRWRTPENTLQALALLGGWPGGLAAQQRLHHKSRKASFQFTFWIVVIINVAALGWLLSTEGAQFLASLAGA